MTAPHSRPTVAPLISRDCISRKHARGAALGRRGSAPSPAFPCTSRPGFVCLWPSPRRRRDEGSGADAPTGRPRAPSVRCYSQRFPGAALSVGTRGGGRRGGTEVQALGADRVAGRRRSETPCPGADARPPPHAPFRARGTLSPAALLRGQQK